MILQNVKKIKGDADKNGPKNVTCKQGLTGASYNELVHNKHLPVTNICFLSTTYELGT